MRLSGCTPSGQSRRTTGMRHCPLRATSVAALGSFRAGRPSIRLLYGGRGPAWLVCCSATSIRTRGVDGFLGVEFWGKAHRLRGTAANRRRLARVDRADGGEAVARDGVDRADLPTPLTALTAPQDLPRLSIWRSLTEPPTRRGPGARQGPGPAADPARARRSRVDPSYRSTRAISSSSMPSTIGRAMTISRSSRSSRR